MTEKPYTVAQLAEHWGVSDTFVYDEINRGRLGHLRLGGKLLRVPVSAVAEYEARAAVEPNAAPPDDVKTGDPDARTVARLVRGRPAR